MKMMGAHQARSPGWRGGRRDTRMGRRSTNQESREIYKNDKREGNKERKKKKTTIIRD
jgi:hypothetical protein